VAGEVTVSATGKGENVQITLAGTPLVGRDTPESEFIRETVTAHRGGVEIWREGLTAAFQVVLPRVKRQTVMVVDDNADLVHFYRRYTERTSYKIVHIAEGQQVSTAVQRVKPDVIVLDVMLPDVDGWEVLSGLHENPATCSTPVIICSVVRQEELALALGAALYVPKPVRRQEFIRALDQVLAQASVVNRPVAENR
jgi:CheY-like chemotaxis protein